LKHALDPSTIAVDPETIERRQVNLAGYDLCMRIGRRETRRRLTGLTFPTVLGTGGGGATWDVQQGDRRLAESALQDLENRRVLYNPLEAEVPAICAQSVQEIRTKLAELIAESQEPKLRNALRAIQAACRQFLTEMDGIDGLSILRAGGTFSPFEAMASWRFNQALGSFRARVGTNVAIIIELFDVGVDEHLANIMPPPVDDEDA
jgi:hypothetical protein